MADQINSDGDEQRRPLQLFVKLLNGETLSLQFPTPVIEARCVKQRIYEITKIPAQLQRLIRGHQLKDDSVILHSDVTLNLFLRLLGGKGGFGSLLRGAATKAGQKKTSKFEACRAISGRRLKHVNAERRLEEWKAEQEERREESAKCMAVVEESVREAFKNGKRKVLPDGADAKRLKIWMGKRKLDDNMDEDSSEDEDDEETKKSVVLNYGNHSDSNKRSQSSPGSVTGGAQEGDFSGGVLSESGFEEEKEIVALHGSESGKEEVSRVDNSVVQSDFHEGKAAQTTSGFHTEQVLITGTETLHAGRLENNESETENREEAGGPSKSLSSAENEVVESQIINTEINSFLGLKSGVNEETVAGRANSPESNKPLNFDEFNSPEEMEALGMDRLKSELEARGLKCGGALQERAPRLFVLKSTPLEKLPKKLLAKK
ncbi:hypothetical protein SLEP1_g2267 [Rubroshorea leprosula]|uniref:Ubiquitin-like domain-containing protein n=1 Tax=Rubroshorea leprosula TaxID=152421 RepID=A0AAV5HL04_9ROSI|nr:hypothetical protein SLEP1_g2267 [Rubroshorea leprosula]